MNNTVELKTQIKRLLVENLMLQTSAEEIADDLPLLVPAVRVWILSMHSNSLWRSIKIMG